MTKRLLDILVAGLLLVLLSPLLVVIMAILAVTGEREIFYAQTRIGRLGRPIRVLKLVTMMKGSSKMAGGTLTVPDDPRVLPVGKILRKTKLNELPQLWNVVRGDMSLVGPRPLAEDDFACYSEAVQREVVKVRPGLTGVGSVVFRDEERRLAESDLPPLECYRLEIAPRKGALESWYVENQSLGLDLKLLALTVVAVLAPRSTLHERMLELPSEPEAG
jgi:lipopolysaccharide/colanic/teichoic acid biosynthesis glycosyltransferase